MIRCCLILSVFFLSSCVFRQASQLPEPKHREQTQSNVETVLHPNAGEEVSASIGDVILSYTRINTSSEVVTASAPYSLVRLPTTGWENTHMYKSYNVYTHPTYYRGTVGAVLDRNEYVMFFMQTGGLKSGKRWRASRTNFFGFVSTVEEDWRLRYSGRDKAAYKFEIANHSEDKANQAIQSFEVSEDRFFSGFAVRGVMIKGLKGGSHGIISYRIDGAVK